MAVSMLMAFLFMVVMMLLLMAVAVCMAFLLMAVVVPWFMAFLSMFMTACSMQVLHIMIAVFVLFVQQHQKITGIQSRFFYSADFYGKPVCREAFQRFSQYVFISAQIQQRCDSHIAADTGRTFQI